MALTQISTAGVKDDAVTSGKIPANAVGSSEIADEAVTLAKLPHGTSSNDGKFLRANNGADPTFETVTGTTINNNADNKVITGSGTANTLEGQANLIFDGSNLGIGTNNPSGESINGSQNLVIMDTSSDGGMNIKTGTSANAQIHFSDTSGNGQGRLVYDHSNDSMKLFTSGSERVRINSDGRVGIGKTASSTVDIETANNANGFNLNCIGTAANYMFNVRDDNVSKFFIKNDGKVGIGTDSPTRTISAHVTDSGANYIHLTNTETGTGDANGTFIGLDAAEGALIWNQENNYVRFGTNNAERMRINSDGDVLIGRTTTIDTSEVLGIKGPSGDHCTFGITTANNSSLGIIAFNDSDANFRGQIRYSHQLDTMQFMTSGSERINLSADGIKFNGDSAAANGLGDYEEGSYTATIYGSTNGVTSPFGMNPNKLRYTKVGRVVHVTGRVYINSTDGSVLGSARMLLPFTSASNNQGNDGQAYSYVTRYNVYSPNNDWNLTFEVEPNSTYGNFLWCKPGSTWANAAANGHLDQTAAYYGFDFSYTTS